MIVGKFSSVLLEVKKNTKVSYGKEKEKTEERHPLKKLPGI